jgi:hypothetical protein
LVRGTKTLDLIKGEFPKGKYLFAVEVDGRNIWANDLAASLSTLVALEGIVGKGTYSFLLFFACIFGTMINIFMSRNHS